MFIINVTVALFLLYITVGLATLFMALMGVTFLYKNNRQAFNSWIDDRPIKSIDPWTQLFLGCLLLWPVIIGEWVKQRG